MEITKLMDDDNWRNINLPGGTNPPQFSVPSDTLIAMVFCYHQCSWLWLLTVLWQSSSREHRVSTSERRWRNRKLKSQKWPSL